MTTPLSREAQASVALDTETRTTCKHDISEGFCAECYPPLDSLGIAEAQNKSLRELVQVLKDIETWAVVGIKDKRGRRSVLKVIAAKAHNAVRGL